MSAEGFSKYDLKGSKFKDIDAIAARAYTLLTPSIASRPQRLITYRCT